MNARFSRPATLEAPDPMSPPPPQEAHFDMERQAWVLSRYDDVVAALREPGLVPSSAKKGNDPDASSKRRVEVLSAISPSKMAEWQAQIGHLAHKLANDLAVSSSVDVVREFLEPW